MDLDRAVADSQRLSDRAIGEALHDAVEYLALTW